MFIYSDYYIILWHDLKDNTEFIKCIKHLPLEYRPGYVNNYQHQILGIFLIKNNLFFTLEEYLQYCIDKNNKKSRKNAFIDKIINKLEKLKNK